MFGFLFRLVRFVFVSAIVVFVLIQFVPYRLKNPPVQSEPKWDSARTHALVVASCYDCHSNQTQRHWYTQIAPFSWLSVKEVRKGRAALNFSAWTATSRPAMAGFFAASASSASTGRAPRRRARLARRVFIT